MTPFIAPLSDIRFVLYDVLKIEALYARLPGGESATRDIVDAILEEAAKFTMQVISPLNMTGDQEGCHFDGGAVRTPRGFKEAYAQYVANGWTGLTAPLEYGGQNLPESIGCAVKEMIDSANLSWGNYPLLCHGATEALRHHGEQWQRELFLKPIVEGRWTGTMCLTEPHCGTDLGLLKTRAEPADDGSYKISGTKIFITAGEHDFTDNIVHLVLARIAGAPSGTHGISMFIVPKVKIGKDGKIGERNAVACGSIEHKMGIRASVTCVMNFDGAEAWLIGEPNKGLNAMFTMMNAARLGVGLQGLGLIERGYQCALAYARDRLQMRALSGAKRPDKPADPLIVHPDIRRMLLTQKAFVEGGRVLAYHTATLLDTIHRSTDSDERKYAEELSSFLTPIVKGLLTEAANECAYDALQIFGGHGYIKESGIEQIARDARITTIYEGTTQIQALDLLSRKIIGQHAAGLRHFSQEIGKFCQLHSQDATLAEFIGPLAKATQEWLALTQEIVQSVKSNVEEVGAAAVDYLFFSGYVVLAYYWARGVHAAQLSQQSAGFKESKLATARFYFQRLLPRTLSHAVAIRAGSTSLMALPEDRFAAT